MLARVRQNPYRRNLAKGATMLNSFIAFYGWEPVAWFGMSVAAFFGAVLCLRLYAAGKG